jgi:ATP synthase F1 delta subunit
MSKNVKLVQSYAKSLFRIVKRESKDIITQNFNVSTITSPDQKKFVPTVSVIGEELLLLRSLLVASPTMNKIFRDPTYPEIEKLSIIATLFPGLTDISQAFLQVVKERNQLYLLPEISDEYHALIAKLKNSIKVRVIVATPLSESFGSLLLASLKNLTKGNEIILSLTYRPMLLGGIIVEYNSLSIDASILKELSFFIS